MKLPTTPNFGVNIFNSRPMSNDAVNSSVYPTIFDTVLSNKKMSESLQKATACRKGAAALDELKNGSPPIGFTGHIHPLSEAAEHATQSALASEDSESHEEAASAHDAAATKMSSFLKETGPRTHKDYGNKSKGLTATREHHIKRATAHRHRAIYLKDKEEKADAAKEKEKGDKSKKKGK